MEEAMENSNTRGYFNSAQAIADYAEVILYVKQKLSAHNSPVIVVGGSYGGMLASCFRLKYPHIALGALASSAPILYFDNITPQDGYYTVITKDFRSRISSQWPFNPQPNIQDLQASRQFLLLIKHSSALKNYLDSIYTEAAQYNHPPEYPVTMICGGIDGAAGRTDILGQIFAGIHAYIGDRSCYNKDEYSYSSETDMGWNWQTNIGTKSAYGPGESNIGWSWQTCSEMVMPIGRGINDTMFPPSPFNLQSFISNCKSYYGVTPRPHWITTYYGGHDIKMALHRFGSNIIFSNGLRDPYSSGGVMEDISDNVLAVYTAYGSHCLDLHPARKDDPQWLVMQRQVEVNIIEGWIKNYYADLVALQS
ncbi:unnamed protein product [Ilex paraguariensis]|uniref:Lysosomal Pro-X carboxypeptidase n=1 Tax=Ilex paraguariensis TaxID=185542 RepID=A0ABC8RZR3_9AQUA